MNTPRFHTRKADGLFQPIPFLFVTERMCAEILAERQALLDALPEDARKRQQALFARYDPGVSAEAFSGLLDLFHGKAA
ncbi:hypothetical protein [Thauera sp. WH-1]|uniref:hypothetical protein n=1 Tax=Thauera sp. WH-1 TaxID=3398230 RepID=UPI0039FCEF92